jgi:hypothetical protein
MQLSLEPHMDPLPVLCKPSPDDDSFHIRQTDHVAVNKVGHWHLPVHLLVLVVAPSARSRRPSINTRAGAMTGAIGIAMIALVFSTIYLLACFQVFPLPVPIVKLRTNSYSWSAIASSSSADTLMI